MTRALIALLASIAVDRAASGMLFTCRYEVTAEGVLEKTVEITGAGPGRLETGFDPATQSLEVLEASAASPGGSRTDLPAWAVDTLAGSGGFPALVIALFPPGGGGILKLRIRDWSWNWSGRLWFVVTPPPGCDSSIVEVADGRGMRWEGPGWTAQSRGDDLLLRAGAGAGSLRASSYESWQEMYSDLTAAAGALLEAEQPLSVREAAIEASAGGADPPMLLARLRTLLCNSIGMIPPPPTMSAFAPLDPGAVLERRRATDMEAAVLFSAIAASAGIEAGLVLASNEPSRLPIPGEWNRVLVEAGAGGRRFLYEPHATLVPAAYIRDAERLRLLRPGDTDPVEYTPPPCDRCREQWTMTGPGEWTVEVETGGLYDGRIRRRLAGLGDREARGAVAAMLWRSGIVSIVDSCWTGDLYDLSEPACFGAEVTVPCSPSSRYRLLPAIAWDGGGDFARSWNLPEGASFDAELVEEDGIATDTLPNPPRRIFGIGP
ncbi:hypothetical protein GX411_10395 [Candidatus Fermentibacteria bacterium]|nr:hypothetical protein [Candidatus Fermentibacteria bacterium]